MLFRDLENQKVAILGYGLEGKAALGVLRRTCPKLFVTVIDHNPGVFDHRKREAQVNFVVGDSSVEQLLAYDVLIKSPGISLYKKDLVGAAQQGVYVTSLTSLWLANQRGAITIGVTGTKGKSTTSSMLRDILTACGKRVALRGNVGRPLFDQDDPESEADYVIIELSSFQLADLKGSLDFAVITNLAPEHLDWHGAVERYFDDKLRIVALARQVLASKNCPELQRRLAGAKNVQWFGHGTDLSPTSSGIEFEGDLVIASDQMNAPGPHNLMNACAALGLGRSLGIGVHDGIHAAKSFCSLSHRLETVATKDNRLFVNDSMASTPLATMAALGSFPGRAVQLIVGGADRGLNLDEMVNALSALHGNSGVQFLGPFGERLLRRCQAHFKDKGLPFAVGMATNLEQAVEMSWQQSKSGDIILLSPGAPSFDCYRNFAHRGEAFRQAVAQLTSSSEGQESGFGNFDS